MKTLARTILALLLAVSSALAQFGAPGGAGGPPPGLGMSGSTAKLFGDNATFSATLEMQTSGGQESENMSTPGKIYFDHGKTRFELDMTQLRGGKMSPEAAAQMKSIGMDKVIMISRPDKKLDYQVYPGMLAYVQNAFPENETRGEPTDYKLETTEIGKETIDGHPCLKSKAVVTDKQGGKHESLIWMATDLKKFPIRIEQAEGGTKLAMLFKDVKLSKPAAEVFEAPTDATRYDSLQSMLQQVMMKRLSGGNPPQGQ